MIQRYVAEVQPSRARIDASINHGPSADHIFLAIDRHLSGAAAAVAGRHSGQSGIVQTYPTCSVAFALIMHPAGMRAMAHGGVTCLAVMAGVRKSWTGAQSRNGERSDDRFHCAFLC